MNSTVQAKNFTNTAITLSEHRIVYTGACRPAALRAQRFFKQGGGFATISDERVTGSKTSDHLRHYTVIAWPPARLSGRRAHLWLIDRWEQWLQTEVGRD